MAWSSGKDSALALHELLQSATYETAALLTTVTQGYERISMHGVRRLLLERQADALGLPLEQVVISQNCSNEEYESKMQEALLKYRHKGVSAVAFGDIFLEDLRAYREEKLSAIGMTAVFPLWQKDTRKLADSVVACGFEAVVTCIDSQALDKSFVGRLFDRRFLSDLPPAVDPCGENGEFHTFVFNGPIFGHPIAYRKGETVLRDGRFYFCDLMPV